MLGDPESRVWVEQAAGIPRRVSVSASIPSGSPAPGLPFPRSQQACCLIHFPVGTTVISNHQKWKSMLLFGCLWYEIRKLRRTLQNHKNPSHSNNNNDNTTYRLLKHLLCASMCICNLIELPHGPCPVYAMIAPILQLGKLRHREVHNLAQSHSASKWQTYGLNPDSSDSLLPFMKYYEWCEHRKLWQSMHNLLVRQFLGLSFWA